MSELVGENSGLSVVRAVLSANIAGWAEAGVEDTDIEVEGCSETEWHQVFFLASSKGKVVFHLPSWRGAALANRAAAAQFMFEIGLGPTFFGPVEVSRADSEMATGEASEWLSGGQISGSDLQNPNIMRRIGVLYGNLHVQASSWFDASVPALQAEGWLPAGDQASNWASCIWILVWLLRQVPQDNRAVLSAQGVDWDFIEAEIIALPSNELLPATPVVTVHGDGHPGNIVKDAAGELRLIDFDMTARGPAGSEFGFLTLMLFRCGFSPEAVMPLEVQRAFAQGYVSTGAAPSVETPAALGVDDIAAREHEDRFLQVMHSWTYVGLLKMGLLCAVLMANDGHKEKRAVMRARGPVLLHPGFLRAAQDCLRQAQSDKETQADLLSRGLFFVAEERWRSTASSV